MNNSQEVANIIKTLAKSKKVAIGKMLSECSLSVNTLSSMKSGGYYPRLEAIAKIADYLDCSVDYLLGRTNVLQSANSNPENIAPAEQSMLNLFRELNEEGQERVINYTDDLVSSGKYIKTDVLGVVGRSVSSPFDT